MAMDIKNILNSISLNGVVMGYKIEKRDSVMMWDNEKQGIKKGDKVIQYNGYITILTKDGDNQQFATVSVQRNQQFYNGELDFTSQALEDMANENVDTYNKTRDITKTPTIGVYRGVKLVDNYYVKDQELHEGIKVDLGFGNIKLGEPTEEPKMENVLNVSALITDVEAERDKDEEETGRAIVKMVIPYTYGSKDKQVIRAVNFSMVAGKYEDEEGEYDLGADLLDYSDEVIGYSYLLIGELNGFYMEPEAKQEESGEQRRGFGKRAKVQTQRKRGFEYLLTGLDMLADGDAFPEDEIQDAIQERQRDIAEKMKRDEEKQSQQDTTTKGRGSFGGGRTSTPGATAGDAGTAPAGRTRRDRSSFMK